MAAYSRLVSAKLWASTLDFSNVYIAFYTLFSIMNNLNCYKYLLVFYLAAIQP